MHACELSSPEAHYDVSTYKHTFCSPITPDGYFLTSASKDGQPQLRDGATGDWIGTFQGHKGAVWACVLNDPAFVAATGSADFTARVWNAVTGDEVHQFQHKHIVRTVSFQHGQTATRIVTGGPERLLRIFDLSRPDAEPTVLSSAPDNIRNAIWSQDNSSILVSYIDRPGIDIFDIRSTSIVRTLESKGPVTSIELTDNGQYIVTTDGHAITFRQGSTYNEIKSHQVEGYIAESASYCPEKNKFVAGGSDMWVHVHDFSTGGEIESGRGHHGPIHCIRFAPGGSTYASGSEDGTIRIWQTEFASMTADGNGVTHLDSTVNGGGDTAA